MPRTRFCARPANRFRSKQWQALNEREDDQIAPKAATSSTNALQRWAIATMSIAQGCHRANESRIVERIRDRYESDVSSLSLYEYIDRDLEAVRSNTTLQPTALTKSKRTPLSTGSSHLDTLYEKDIETNAQQANWRKSQGASSIDVDDKYAQSSECSFLSDGVVKVTKTVVKTKTCNEVD